MKIVKESLNEFHKTGDPFKSLGVGGKAVVMQKLKDLAAFIEEQMDWNGPKTTVNDDYTITYTCMPGNSVNKELGQVIKDFGLGNQMKIEAIDSFSRFYDDGAWEHEYLISFKKNSRILKSINEFHKTGDPYKSLGLGAQGILAEEDKKHDWAWNVSWYDKPTEIIDIVNYYGNFIKIVKVGNSYVAINDSGEPYLDEPDLWTNAQSAIDGELEMYNYIFKEDREHYTKFWEKMTPYAILGRVEINYGIRELDKNINEFHKTGDPLGSLGIGRHQFIIDTVLSGKNAAKLTTGMSQDELLQLMKTIKPQLSDDIIDASFDLASEFGSGFDVYLGEDGLRELLTWVLLLGKKNIKVVSIAEDDPIPKKFEEKWPDIDEIMEYHRAKKVEPYLDKGWWLFNEEQNGDIIEYILIKERQRWPINHVRG